MLADMLVGSGANIVKELGIFLGEARHDIVVGTRHENLSGFGEAHDALADIDAVTDDVFAVVDIVDHLDRAQVDSESYPQGRAGYIVRSGDDGIPQIHGRKQGIFRVTQKTNGRSVSSIQNDPLVGGHILDGFADEAVELIFESNLDFHGLCGIIGDVAVNDAADECPVFLFYQCQTSLGAEK